MTRETPCGWEPDAPCNAGPCCPDVDTFPTEKALAEKLAAALLWRLTGMRYGCCEVTVRPCKANQCDPMNMTDLIYWDQRILPGGDMGVYNYSPTLIDGQVYNIACGCKQGCCSCKADCEFKLPGPICDISRIQVNGFDLAPEDYIVYEPNTIAILKTTQPSSKAGRLLATAQPYNLGDRWTFTPNSVGGTGRTNYGGNVWGPAESPGAAFYNTFPELPDNHFDFTYVSAGAPGPKSIAVAPRAGGLDAPSCAYEWNTTTYPNGTVLNVGDSITSSTISDPDCDDGSFYRLTVLDGTATVNGARALDLSANFSARVEFFEPGTCVPCQDYNKKLGENGTWGVTYRQGIEVPDELNYAAGLYACELAKAMVGDKSCSLPERVSSVVRPGINVAFVDPFLLAVEGLTGLAVVDTIIRALNPYKLRQVSAVWSPDLPKYRRERP